MSSVVALLLLGCEDEGSGNGGDNNNNEQTGQINTAADIENKLEAENKSVEISDCVILIVKDSNGNTINTGEISDINSGISTANTFGAISDEEAAATEEFIEDLLEKAGCD